MVKKLYLIGIGPGDPKYLTLQAKELIERLELFFVPEKIGKKSELTKKRLEIIKFVKGNKPFRVVHLPFPERERGINYQEKVREWRSEKAKILKEALEREEQKEAGFLIWGDPSLYDGHIDIMKEVEKELEIDWEVVPGLSSFQVLSARAKVSLTNIATPLTFHTPRTLRKLKELEHPVVVFLDNYETFQLFKEKELEICWGAYVGNEEEVILKGPINELTTIIKAQRKALKEKKGYLMEIYCLKPKDKNG